MKFFRIQSLLVLTVLSCISSTLMAEVFKNRSNHKVRVLIFKGNKGDRESLCLIEKFILPRKGKKCVDLSHFDPSGVFVVVKAIRAGDLAVELNETDVLREALSGLLDDADLVAVEDDGQAQKSCHHSTKCDRPSSKCDRPSCNRPSKCDRPSCRPSKCDRPSPCSRPSKCDFTCNRPSKCDRPNDRLAQRPDACPTKVDHCERICGASLKVCPKNMHRRNEFLVCLKERSRECKLKIKLVRPRVDHDDKPAVVVAPAPAGA